MFATITKWAMKPGSQDRSSQAIEQMRSVLQTRPGLQHYLAVHTEDTTWVAITLWDGRHHAEAARQRNIDAAREIIGDDLVSFELVGAGELAGNV